MQLAISREIAATIYHDWWDCNWTTWRTPRSPIYPTLCHILPVHPLPSPVSKIMLFVDAWEDIAPDDLVYFKFHIRNIQIIDGWMSIASDMAHSISRVHTCHKCETQLLSLEKNGWFCIHAVSQIRNHPCIRWLMPEDTPNGKCSTMNIVHRELLLGA